MFSKFPWLVRVLKIVLVVISGIALAVWLVETPAGLLGKLDAVAYAVCHRIPSRSFFIGDRPIPLCARCTGMHLGAFIGLVYHFFRGKRGKMPPIWIFGILAVFLMAFGFDGVNSYIQLFPGVIGLYQPQNWLRLLTGTGLGLGLSIILYPTFNQTLWMDWRPEPALANWKQFGLLLLTALAVDALTLTNIPLILYPLAIISSLNVLIILGTVYAILWTLIFQKENKYSHFRETWPILLGGFTTALIQILLMDFGRYLLTGTWEGFSFG